MRTNVPTVPSPELSVSEMADLTPTTRDRTVDLLRAGAIAVVVLWHWVFSVTHWTGDSRLTMPNPIGNIPGLWLATWLLQVMPLFFVVGGVANLAAWKAAVRDGVSARTFVLRAAPTPWSALRDPRGRVVHLRGVGRPPRP